MDDAARRREARRRKILENSENRLRKITGNEEKSNRVLSCENHTGDGASECSSDFLLLNSNKEIIEENTVEPQSLNLNHKGTNETKQNQPQKQHRTIVIIALAIFVNYQLLILEKLFKVNVNSSHLNKIFIPVLVYEVIELIGTHKHRTENKNFLYLLIVANAKNRHILPLIRYLELITKVLQDVMIYFFTYVCCDAIKYVMWLLS